jgi:hypothetical protein
MSKIFLKAEIFYAVSASNGEDVCSKELTGHDRRRNLDCPPMQSLLLIPARSGLGAIFQWQLQTQKAVRIDERSSCATGPS